MRRDDVFLSALQGALANPNNTTHDAIDIATEVADIVTPKKVSKSVETPVLVGRPSKGEFVKYGLSLVAKTGRQGDFKYTLEVKYDSWVENKWKDGHNKTIKNWKTKLANTLPYLKPMTYDNQPQQTKKKLIDGSEK